MRDTVRLTAVPNEAEAEVILGLLRSEGIEGFSRPGEMSTQGLMGQGSWHEVLVYESDLARARELLAAAEVDLDAEP
jgi:hypothetical protein